MLHIIIIIPPPPTLPQSPLPSLLLLSFWGLEMPVVREIMEDKPNTLGPSISTGTAGLSSYSFTDCFHLVPLGLC